MAPVVSAHINNDLVNTWATSLNINKHTTHIHTYKHVALKGKILNYCHLFMITRY